MGSPLFAPGGASTVVVLSMWTVRGSTRSRTRQPKLPEVDDWWPIDEPPLAGLTRPRSLRADGGESAVRNSAGFLPPGCLPDGGPGDGDGSAVDFSTFCASSVACW